MQRLLPPKGLYLGSWKWVSFHHHALHLVHEAVVLAAVAIVTFITLSQHCAARTPQGHETLTIQPELYSYLHHSLAKIPTQQRHIFKDLQKAT